MKQATHTKSPHVVIIGAGIGGLTTGAMLAERGYPVTVLEAGVYPGGSAGTFYHQGYRFEAGATLAGGFQAGGPHAVLAERLDLKWPVRPTAPAWTVHLPERTITLTQDNADVLAQFPASEPFWREQSQIADVAWSLAAAGLPWPPTTLSEAGQLVRAGISKFPADLALLPYAFRSVQQWLSRHNLAQDRHFRRFIDAQLLISAQTTSEHANALYSATALDLPRQGVMHVAGGIGHLAQTLVDAIQAHGGQVLYKQHVTRIAVEHARAVGVHTQHRRREEDYFPADFVIANLTPWSLDGLLQEDSPARLRREVAQLEPGWGAFVLYLGLNNEALPPGLADHHQIVTSLEGPLGEGRSIFVSLSPTWDSSRAPKGHRAVTVTTHTDVKKWWHLAENDVEAYQALRAAYTAQMLDAINNAIPGFRHSIAHIMDGTPVTYHTWIHRHLGMVGGFPQTSLLRARGPRTGLRNVRLVGDSIFPGQSTAGVTVGAMRVAEHVLHILPRPVTRKLFQPQATG